jgi:uncharacterized RDD family membrane protein YckC
LSTSSNLQSSDSPEVVPLWKQEVNERLAAHRTRRPRKAEDQARLPLDIEPGESRSAQVAARVAARYAKAPSYSEVLAEEARNAAQVAHAAAEDAMVAAQAVLDGMRNAVVEEPVRNIPVPPRQNIAPSAPFHQESASRLSDAFVEEIVEPIESIAGNVIQFPREIVAPRKARPRLAEGPLREESVAEAPQLRIFEVDTETISKTPETPQASSEWSSIRLDARSAEHIETDPSLVNYLDIPLNVATMGDRLMAGLVDLSLAGLAFLVFVLVFVACTAHPPMGKPALAAAGVTLVFFFLLYQFLFFTYSEATPGMRYARIALCTFEDENPTRSQMRSRIGAIMLSACTLGMGFAWAFFDEDGLGWHDRLSHTYQRSYR